MCFDNGVERDGNLRTSCPPPQTRMHMCVCGLEVVTRRCKSNYTELNYTFNISLLSGVPLIINVKSINNSFLHIIQALPDLCSFTYVQFKRKFKKLKY